MKRNRTDNNKHLASGIRHLVSLFALSSLLLFGSCKSLRPWERVYINDPQMQAGNKSGKNFSNYVHSIREGAVPAGSVKSSGGCGCN